MTEKNSAASHKNLSPTKQKSKMKSKLIHQYEKVIKADKGELIQSIVDNKDEIL